jgi:hypothetical protein
VADGCPSASFFEQSTAGFDGGPFARQTRAHKMVTIVMVKLDILISLYFMAKTKTQTPPDLKIGPNKFEISMSKTM